MLICHLEAMAERQRGRSQSSRPVAFDACGRKLSDSDAAELIGRLGGGEGMTALAKLFARRSAPRARETTTGSKP